MSDVRPIPARPRLAGTPRSAPAAAAPAPGAGRSAFFQRLGVWLLLFAAWEGAYRLIGWESYKFPAPSHVLDATMELLNVHTAFGEPVHRGWPAAPPGSVFPAARPWYQSPMVQANLVSLGRLLEGFAISIVLGGLLGMAMWRSGWLDQFLGPLFLGMQTLPSVCWVPLAVIIFGLNEQGILFVLVMGSFFAIAIAMRDGLRTIPPLYQRAGLMMGATGWRLYRYVLLPASLPAFVGSLRQGFSFAWRSLLGAEMVLAAQQHGLGFHLDRARNLGAPELAIAVMIVMIAVGMLADRLIFAKIQKAVNARFGLA